MLTTHCHCLKMWRCLDPRDLNKAVKHAHYPLPLLEDVASRLHKAKIFSVFDAKTGFLQIKLDEKSSVLTHSTLHLGDTDGSECHLV